MGQADNAKMGAGQTGTVEIRDWRRLPFSQAVIVNPPVALDRDSTYAFVDMAAVHPGSRYVEASQTRKFSGGGARFRAGDTLMARITPCLENGKIARYRDSSFESAAYGSTEFIVVRGRPDVTDDEFAYYLTRWDGVRGYAISQMTGTSGRQRVATESLGDLAVLVPPLWEQRTIAQALGVLDDKIELNHRTATTLDEAVRALYGVCFRDSTTQLGVEHTGTVPPATLREYASLNPESWSATSRPDSVAYVDLSNTKRGTIAQVEHHPWSSAPSRARRVLRSGDTIVGTVRPGNGSFALVGREGLTASTGFAVLRPKEGFDAAFVWCAATSKANIERLARLADGGAYPAVSAEAVAATTVARTDSTTRRKFSRLTAPLVAKGHAVRNESEALATLRDTLLPKLISGEIRIPDAEKIVEAAT